MYKKLILLLLLISIISLSFAGCGNKTTTKATSTSAKSKEKVKLIIWGLNPTAVGGGDQAMIDAFNKTHPNMELVPQTPPAGESYTTQDLTKLLTAIAGGTPPDITTIDRFGAGEYAARGALIPLDEYIKKYNFDISNFYKFAIEEASLDGKIYVIPYGTDDRGFYWNKKLFREVGLDPDRPPQTWDELLGYSKKLTKTKGGTYERIGFIPDLGPSKQYIYGFQKGAKYLSDDGKKALLTEKPLQEAFEFMVKAYDIVGGAEKVRAFEGTFQKDANNPFFLGLVAMKDGGSWELGNIARFAPDLDFGVSYIPSPTGAEKVTWAGGWSWGIPKGAKHPDEAFQAIKWIEEEGQFISIEAQAKYNASLGRPFVPGYTANKVWDQKLYETYIPKLNNQRLQEAYKFFMDIFPTAKHRPVTPVGQTLWDELMRATDKAVYHQMSVQQALQVANENVQKALDEFWSKNQNK